MIITLAGHVDHGKTSLVHALTGINTDRLEEEKKRGLTIDLGFAYLGDGSLGFVDVPGHQKFIHNMVAGVAAKQHGLMVIAADDGPMPQSKEHLDILNLIGVSSGTIALTKSDKVDKERLKECELEIMDLVQGSPFESASIYRTSIDEPDSFKPLLHHLKAQTQEVAEQNIDQVFRIAIDRVFAVSGAGTVVTGTIHGGSIETDSTLFHYPTNQEVKVRGIRAQDQKVAKAIAGDRCSINITGLSADQITRGEWLSSIPLPPLTNLSVEVSALTDFPRNIKHWSPVHVYHATSHSTGRIALLESNSLKPGEAQLADIVLDKPLASFHADKLILRDQSLDLTLGGARVLCGEQKNVYRRRSAKRIQEIKANSVDTYDQALINLLKNDSVDIDKIAQNWMVSKDAVVETLEKEGAKISGSSAIDQARWQGHLDASLKAVTSKNNGLRENELPTSVPKDYRQALLNELVQQGEIEHNGGVYRSSQSSVQIPNELQNIWKVLETKLAVKQAPSSGDIAKELKKNQAAIEKQMRALVKLGQLVEIANHRFYLPQILEQIRKDIVELAERGPFSVADFREFTGISRNVAIEVLEHFDHKGVTRRQENTRILIQR